MIGPGVGAMQQRWGRKGYLTSRPSVVAAAAAGAVEAAAAAVAAGGTPVVDAPIHLVGLGAFVVVASAAGPVVVGARVVAGASILLVEPAAGELLVVEVGRMG